MNADQWRAVKEVFHRAVGRAASERASFLAEACNGDDDVRAEVERLLVAEAQAGSFIEHSPVERGSGSADSSEPLPMSGRVIGRYKIGRLIGVGGMGEVYAARDVELGRDVAVKIASGTDLDARARLRQEAQHASQLNHPHICTIHEVGTSDGQPFIVMEYVDGRRLSDAIPPGGLPIEEVQRYGAQIADALAHAHRQGVIHRDLKPANVVITDERGAKVLDFGLARRLRSSQLEAMSKSRRSLAEEGLIAGTLSYIAPEVLRGERADERSDVWAFGVLLYEMATGTRPFAGATGFELSAAILQQPFAPLPSRLPGALQTIIRRCLAKDTRDRYQEAAAIRDALETLETKPARVDRRKLVFAIGVVLAVLMAGTVAWRWARPPGAPTQAAASGRPTIAVMPFERAGAASDQDAAWMSSGVSTMLMTGLAQSQGLNIISTNRLSDVIRRRGLTGLATLDKSQAADVAREAGAGAVVIGTIFRAGSEIRIDAQVEDLGGGRVLAAQTVRGSDLFTLVDQLAGKIREGVGLGTGQDVRNVADVSTSSLEAFRLFSLGTDAVNNGRDDGMKYLEQAVAIDPGFAEAYLTLATHESFVAQPERLNEYLRKAAEHVDRLSERRRLLLNVQVARASGRDEEAKRLLEQLLETFPDTEEGYIVSLLMYPPEPGKQGDIDKLLKILAKGAATLPNSRQIHNVTGYALISAGRYSEAIREFERYVELSPREPNPFDSLGESYVAAGEPGKAIDAYARALSIDPTFKVSHSGRAWSLAMLGRYDEAIREQATIASMRVFILSRAGRYKDAEQNLAAARPQAVEREDVEGLRWLALVSSVLAIDRHDYSRALDEIRSTDNLTVKIPADRLRGQQLVAHLLGGIAEIGVGRLDRARGYLEAERHLGEPTDDVYRWWYKALEGELALAGGDNRQATAAFAAGEPRGKMWFNISMGAVNVMANALPYRDGAARAARSRGDLTEAIRIYRSLLAYGPRAKWTTPLEPRYVLEIARLLEQTGNTAGARAEYQRFLRLWQHADADLPELNEAKLALQRLAVS